MTRSLISEQLLDFNNLLKQLGKILFTGRLLMTSVPVSLIWIGVCSYTYEAFIIPLYFLLEISKHHCFALLTLILFLCFSTKITFPAYFGLYKNFPRSNQKEICFKLKFLNSGMIMQTGRIYLTFSQLLNQVEIIDSPSAMIKMENLNEEEPFLFLFQPSLHFPPTPFFS